MFLVIPSTSLVYLSEKRKLTVVVCLGVLKDAGFFDLAKIVIFEFLEANIHFKGFRRVMNTIR